MKRSEVLKKLRYDIQHIIYLTKTDKITSEECDIQADRVLTELVKAGMLMPPIYKEDYTGTDEEFWAKAEELFGVWEWEPEDTP